MFLPFFERLRAVGIPVSLREYLAFLEGMSLGIANYDVETFYYLARTAMVKDERHIDRFDRAFADMAQAKRLAKQGKLAIAGPFMDDGGDWRGLFVFAVEDIAQAQALPANPDATRERDPAP